MPLKSLGVPTSDFDNLFARTGTDAASPNVVPQTATGGTKYTYSGKVIHKFASTGSFVTSAGFDKDCEFGFYTEIWYNPPKSSDDPPTPGMSFIEFDINKNTDILGLHRYVAAKVHKLYASSNTRNESMIKSLLSNNSFSSKHTRL